MKQQLDVNKAVEVSGLSVSWWRQRTYRRPIPFYKIGKGVMFDRQDMSKVQDECRIEPSPSGANGGAE